MSHKTRRVLAPSTRAAAGLDLDEEATRLVVERAEGWPAALQLAALTLRGAPDPVAAAAAFGGTDRYVFEYLTEEILAQQPDAVQAFLEATCVSDWLSADLCDALTGRTDGRAMLGRLEEANLLVARSGAPGDAWRCHPLLAGMLRAGLAPDRRAALEAAAGEWFAAAGMTAHAIRHLLRAGAPERARSLIVATAETTLARGAFDTVVDWCQALPPAVLEASPALRVLLAWARFMLGDFAAAWASLADLADVPGDDPRIVARRRCLEAWFANRRDSPDAERLARVAVEATAHDNRTFRSLAHTTLGEALIGSDARAAREAFEEAHRLADPSGPTALRLGTVYSLALTLLTEGRRNDAERACRQAIEANTSHGRQAPALGMVHLLLGIARYEADDLDGARQHITTGWQLCDRGGLRPLLLGAAEWHEALALHALGRRDQAWQRVDAARRDGRRHGVRRIELAMAALAAELLLREGDVAGAAARLAAGDVGEPGPIGATGDRIRLTRARVALAGGDWRQAVAIADPLLQAQDRGNRLGRAAESLVLLAAAWERGGDAARSRAALAQALARCADEDRRSVFLDPVFPLARQLTRSRDIARPFVDDLLARLARRGRGAPGTLDAVAPAGDAKAESLVEPLSARELEVLRLVAAGLSNEEIGRELYVATGTAKWHVHNLLGKSGARDRVGLVAWAHGRALV